MFEGDALQVATLLKKGKNEWSRGTSVIKDARSLLNTFASWTAIHIKREANEATHRLAKDAINLEGDLYGLKEIP